MHFSLLEANCFGGGPVGLTAALVGALAGLVWARFYLRHPASLTRLDLGSPAREPKDAPSARRADA